MRRFALQAAAGAAVALALVLGRLAPAPGWWDANVDPWAPAVAGGVAQARSHPAAGPNLGEVTLVAAPRVAARAAVVTRDGLPVTDFSGGPVTVLAAAGDTLAVDTRVAGLRVRVLAVSRGIAFPHAGGWVSLSPGVTVLGRVAAEPAPRPR